MDAMIPDAEPVTGWTVYVRQLAYARAVQWSDVTETGATFVVLRIETESGCAGAAELAVKPTWVGATAASLCSVLAEIFEPLVRGQGLSDPRQLRASLDAIPGNAPAKALIDNACWDWLAARAGMPLWRQRMGRAKVPVSWAVTRQPPEAMAREAGDMVARHGFRTLKIKGGQGLAVDQACMAAVRRATGDGVALYVDANGAYPVGQAETYARAMIDAGALVVEDPCAFSPDREFSLLQQAVDAPLLVDFGMTDARDARLFLERGARALSIKPGRFGLSQAWQMQHLAHAVGADAVAGLMGESALGTWAGLQFASTMPRPLLPAELTWFLAMREQFIADAPRVVDGEVALPDWASVCERVDWAAMDDFKVAA
ncbi:mandelate racemase/muconate lactonizing enzyme family protein [Bordetella genomosp. 13]|uniref:mandelate racemase/muconate lactonizing enzyme family protein n=1 Tax=Bordetella genomosp. 13 TaxID=463040 RepID=UPI0011A1ABFA|nr:enolase C-terminal domain-like protein [Bordetella genomosp. 13]